MRIFFVRPFFSLATLLATLVLAAAHCDDGSNATVALNVDAFVREIAADIVETGQRNALNLTDNDLKLSEEFTVGIFKTGIGFVRGLNAGFRLTRNVTTSVVDANLTILAQLTVPNLHIEWPTAMCFNFPCTLLLKMKKNLFNVTLTFRSDTCEVQHEPHIVTLDEMEATAKNYRVPAFFPEMVVRTPLILLTSLLATNNAKDWVKKLVRDKMMQMRIFTSSNKRLNCDKFALYLAYQRYSNFSSEVL